jgi:hypothetical protein
MKVWLVVLVLASAIAASSLGVHAQGGAAAAAARLATPAPTGSMSALTKAASAVRAARAAALSGRALSTGAGAQLGRTTQIMGYLWTSNNGAITNATVQIRNTVTNTIDAITRTNSAGEFLFQNVSSGEYVIEYVSDSASKLLALGHPFTVSPGETVATFVRLSNGLPMLLPNAHSNLTSNVAAQAVTSAAGQGITAIATPLVSAVSPVVPSPAGGTETPPSPPPVVSAIK